MPGTLLIDIADDDRARLARLAAARGVSLEVAAGRLLADRLRELDPDPPAGPLRGEYLGKDLYDEPRD